MLRVKNSENPHAWKCVHAPQISALNRYRAQCAGSNVVPTEAECGFGMVFHWPVAYVGMLKNWLGRLALAARCPQFVSGLWFVVFAPRLSWATRRECGQQHLSLCVPWQKIRKTLRVRGEVCLRDWENSVVWLGRFVLARLLIWNGLRIGLRFHFGCVWFDCGLNVRLLLLRWLIDHHGRHQHTHTYTHTRKHYPHTSFFYVPTRHSNGLLRICMDNTYTQRPQLRLSLAKDTSLCNSIHSYVLFVQTVPSNCC